MKIVCLIKHSDNEHRKVFDRDDVRLVLAMAELQLKYLFHVLEEGPEKDFLKALRGYTSIVSKMKAIPCFTEDNETWQSALTSVQNIYSESSGKHCGREFALKAMNFFAPFLSYSALIPTTPHEWFGCFCYNYAPEEKHIYLHFRNACIPESPFAAINDRLKELSLIADNIKDKGFQPATAGCDSWLNELDVFQGLFPDEYLQSFTVSPPDSKTGYGWWGQFVGKDGRFNEAKAEKFEKTMQFQYRRIIAKCPYKSFVNHIHRGEKGSSDD